MGQIQKAVCVYEKAMELDPDSVEALSGMWNLKLKRDFGITFDRGISDSQRYCLKVERDIHPWICTN